MNQSNENGGERRRSTMSFRVSESQRKRIENLAAQCGMNRSEYLLSRAYGYKPKTRLTFAQTKVRDELIIARAHGDVPQPALDDRGVGSPPQDF